METVLTYGNQILNMACKRPGKYDLDLNKKLILYIDDDYVNYLYFTELLSATGAVVEMVCNPGQVPVSGDVRIIIVMSAFIQRSGNAIIEKVKAVLPDIPIIGVQESENRDSCFPEADKSVYDVFLSRKIDDTHLIETIADLLNKI